MKKVRIIPRLDIKGPNVVKGVRCEGLRVVGRPADLAMKYYQEGADELICMDIVASLYGRSFDFELLRDISKDIFVPITIGGGMKSIHDFNNALRSGADKVAINTYATKYPELIKEAVRKFGSQCVVLSIEAKKNTEGRWEVYTDGGREHTGIDALEWAKKAIELGVGEILLTSIDRDGTRSGFEEDLVQQIIRISPIPVIVHGGAGSINSFVETYRHCQPDALSAAAVFHYGDVKIKNLKKELQKNKIPIRQ